MRNCLYYAGYLPVSLTVALIKMKFIKSFLQLQSYNNKLFYLMKSVSQEELSTLMASYNVNFFDSPSVRKLKMWTYFESTLWTIFPLLIVLMCCAQYWLAVFVVHNSVDRYLSISFFSLFTFFLYWCCYRVTRWNKLYITLLTKSIRVKTW